MRLDAQSAQARGPHLPTFLQVTTGPFCTTTEYVAHYVAHSRDYASTFPSHARVTPVLWHDHSHSHKSRTLCPPYAKHPLELPNTPSPSSYPCSYRTVSLPVFTSLHSYLELSTHKALIHTTFNRVSSTSSPTPPPSSPIQQLQPPAASQRHPPAAS